MKASSAVRTAKKSKPFHASLCEWLWNRLPDHKSLAGYMERRTVLRLGRLHVRLHRLLSADRTPFLHTHPFSYVSVILRGGYTEQQDERFITYSAGHVLARRSSVYHRLESVRPGTLTLFITWERGDRAWNLQKPARMAKPPEWRNYEAGVYRRVLYGRERLCKFDGFWHTAADSVEAALGSVKPSIDQSTIPLLPKVA